MCVPLAVAAIAVTAIGVGVSAYSSIQQGNAQSAALQYQAGVANNNATLAARASQDAIDAGNKAANDKQVETARLIGSERAQAGAAGIDPNSGSPLDVQASTAIVGKEDELTIRSNAGRQAFNYQVQGISDQQQGLLDQAGASNAQTAGTLGAFTSILSGASSVATKWDAFKTAGGGASSGGGAPYVWDGVA